MNWYEHAQNPQAITSIFSAAPALEKVRLLGADLSPQNREAKVFLQLPQFPDRPSPKWAGKGFNVVQMQVDFFCVGSLEVSGWESDEVVTIAVERKEDGKLFVDARGLRCRLSFTSAAFRIARISGYNFGRGNETEGASQCTPVPQ